MRIIKWLILIAVIVVIWKYVLPRAKEKYLSPASSTKLSACGTSAQNASNAWGDGVSRFANPPYDLDAWASFTGDVEARISNAESQCTCGTPSCDKARGALRDLRSLVSEMDSAIRSGAPPPADLVQRQESIDDRIAESVAGEMGQK